MNSLDKLISQFPTLYQSAYAQYLIDMHNDVVGMWICGSISVVCLMAIVGSLVFKIAVDKYDNYDWPFYVCVLCGLILLLTGSLWGYFCYDYWVGHANPTMYIWRELLPNN